MNAESSLKREIIGFIGRDYDQIFKIQCFTNKFKKSIQIDQVEMRLKNILNAKKLMVKNHHIFVRMDE